MSQEQSDSFFLTSTGVKDLARCTHLAVGAHQDDLEVMASHGILECLDNEKKHFVGVTCTSGGGSARSGEYQNYSDLEMKNVRRQEQIKSAQLGKFQAMLQLGFESVEIKKSINKDFLKDLMTILERTQPEIIYTHNLADKHMTHIAVSAHLIKALRETQYKPKRFLGSEVWRGLDWLNDEDKVPLEIKDPKKVSSLIACHHSQTLGGKAYDEAVLGRLKANATFFESHQVDEAKNIWFAIDLMPLLNDENLSLSEFIETHIDKFKTQVQENLKIYS